MNQKNEYRFSSQNHFGAGFILGFLFAVLAIFFLATRKGRELVKKINIEDFEFGQLDEVLSKEMTKITQGVKENIAEVRNGVIKPTEQTEETHPFFQKQSILGRRFFHRKR